VSERHLGQTLGKYRIEELIGSGGFAWVYKAFDPELEIHVALKVLKPQFAGDETFEQRFRREAATAAKLRHPNIIKIYSVGRDGEAVYFAMDYYPSGLAERLEIASCLPEEFVVRVGIDVAQALGYAHREGVIHRDIKVDNILFDNHGNAVVADFGIARALSGYSNQTGTNMVVGTPQYFAPEQARAKPLDGRADIYSLGVTLYRAATGRLPFEGDDWYEIARQHVEEPPPPPRSINPDLTPAFEAAILHCLQKQADDRPATGELLAQELVALLPATLETSAYRTRITGSEPTVVVRSDAHDAIPETPVGPQRKSRGTLWLIGVGLVVAFAVSLALFARSRNAESAPPLGKQPDSSVVVTNPPPATPPEPVTPPDTTARKDSAPKPPRTVGSLVVVAPTNAIVSVNGEEAIGGWSSDSLRPRTYEVSATVPAPAGCATSTVTQSVQVRASARTTKVTLTPRSCGTLVFGSTMRDSRWSLISLTPADSGFRRDGPVPANVMLPVGDYYRAIRREKCSPYVDTVRVQPNRTDQLPNKNPFCP
jgi:serine/threonine-protein kinase